MILQRLYELAQRENLLEDPSVRPAAVACLVVVGPEGQFLGITDRRPRESTPSKKKDAPPKLRIGKGKGMSVPARPVTATGLPEQPWKTNDPAVVGKERPAVFLADTLARVLPIRRLIDPKDQEKFAAQRSTFWRFLNYAAEQTEDPALQALTKFGRWCQDDPGAAERLAGEVEAAGLKHSELCTLAWHDDAGHPVLDRPVVREWWRRFYLADQQTAQADCQQGFCQVTGRPGPLATSIRSRVRGLMGIGCLADAYLVSALPVSESYGLTETTSARVSEDGVEGYTRALNALIGNALPNRSRTSLRVGNAMFLFWTRQPEDSLPVADILEQPTNESVEMILQSPAAGREVRVVDDNHFYCLTLTANSARIVVRDYLETSLPEVRQHLARWFVDLRMIDQYTGEVTATVSLLELARALVRDLEELPPHVPAQLLGAAIYGRPLPDSLLAACLRRLAVEGGAGFRRPRMSLIRLILNRTHAMETPMSEHLNPSGCTPAYLCGRLLAIFERVQSAALGDVNASVVDRFYGTASTAPALVFPRLFKSAEQHLSKLQGERPGQAVNLQKEIEAVTLGLQSFPLMLSLPQQGQFALGFYHQRADFRTRSAVKNQVAPAEQPQAQA